MSSMTTITDLIAPTRPPLAHIFAVHRGPPIRCDDITESNLGRRILDLANGLRAVGDIDDDISASICDVIADEPDILWFATDAGLAGKYIMLTCESDYEDEV
jgi:hypothetical protein